MAKMTWTANYDESKVPEYTLPDPLVTEAGQRITTAEQWRSVRRPDLLRTFENHVYGRMPGRPDRLRVETLSDSAAALDGKAWRKELRVHVEGNGQSVPIDVLLYLPRPLRGPAAGFLTLNFRGNHSIQDDPGITLNRNWMPDDEACAIENHRATEASRGARSGRWSVDRIVGRGYMLATVYCGDIDPDVHDGFRNGVHPLMDGSVESRTPSSWGTIAGWAWGLSRVLDALDQEDDVDQTQIAVMGHSRLGKTALWAGACDERFAAVISNSSGCGGAALSRRCYGETIYRITKSFPHWFCGRFSDYAERESALPVDQHELIALAAPRPVYVASASEDRWADPKGEFLSCLHADPVYRLLGTEGLPVSEWPELNQPTMGRIGYHIRTGKHDVTPYDWDRYLDFLEMHGIGRRGS